MVDPLKDEYDRFIRDYQNKKTQTYTDLNTWFDSTRGQEKFWEFKRKKDASNDTFEKKAILKHLRNSGFLNSYASWDDVADKFNNDQEFNAIVRKLLSQDKEVLLQHYQKNPLLSTKDKSFRNILNYWLANFANSNIKDFDAFLKLQSGSGETKYQILQKEFKAWKKIVLESLNYQDTLKEYFLKSSHLRKKALESYNALATKPYDSVEAYAKSSEGKKHIEEWSKNFAKIIYQIKTKKVVDSQIKNKYFSNVSTQDLLKLYEDLIVKNYNGVKGSLIDFTNGNAKAEINYPNEKRWKLTFLCFKWSRVLFW